MTLYLKNAVWIDPETFAVTHTDLAVQAGPLGGLTTYASIPPLGQRAPEDTLIDCKGRFVTRAFACGHHHIYSALARGMPPASQAPTNFLEVLERIWWRLDKTLDHEMIRASALAVGAACLKNGVTFIIDHHASPRHLEGSLAVIADALDSLGLGHLLCYEMSCRDGEEVKEAGLAESGAYLASGRKGHVGLHASFTVDDDLLGRAVALAQKYQTGVHIHVAEDKADQRHCEQQYGKRVVERLADFGVLELPQSILAHCIHLSDAERALLRPSPCWVVQNAESNQNNNVGFGRYSDLPRVMIGTDGMHSDLVRSTQAAYFIAGHAEGGINPRAAYQRLRNVHAHAALHEAPGSGTNNLVILDYDTPTPVTPENFAGHFCYGLDAGHVHTVISQGRVVVEAGQLRTQSEADILAYANEQALRLWSLLR